MRKKLLALLVGSGLLLAGPAFADDLAAIYQKAVQNDPQLAAAQAGYRAAQEAIPQARAGFLPQAAVSGNVAHDWMEVGGSQSTMFRNGTTDFNTSGYALNITQPIFHKDTFAQRAQADSRVAQADSQLAAARNDLIVRVSGAYFNNLAAQDSLRFAEALKTAIEQQLRQTQQRFNVGLSAITDVQESQARFDLAVAQEIAARNQVDTAREALREIIGTEPVGLAELGNFPLVSPEPANVEKWVQTALETNPQLMAAVAGTRIAQEEIERRRAGHYPTVDLVANRNLSDTTDYAAGYRRTDNTLTFQVSVPIYSGGLTSSRVTEAQELYQQSQDQLEQARRATVRQTREAYLAVITGISQVKAQEQAVSSSETALRATRAGYDVGTRTMVEVLNAEQQLFAARRDLSQARYNFVVATLRLKQAAGTLDPEAVAQVNRYLK